MKNVKKACALLLVMVLLTGLLGSVTVFADETEAETTTITIGSGTLTDGTVDLAVSIANNPGFGALKMTFTLPEGLSYAETPVTAADGLSGMVTLNPANGAAGVILTEDYAADGVLFTLHLTGSGAGTVSAKIDTFVNGDLESLSAAVTSGTVTAAAHTHEYAENGFCTVDDALDPDAASYTVTNAAQLHAVALEVNDDNSLGGKMVKLENNVDLSAYASWTPIGGETAFAGTFDGQNHEITGLTITSTEDKAMYLGLFGSSTGTVKNFTVSGTITYTASSIDTAGDFIAGAVGLNAGAISGVTNKVTITAANGCNVGGVAGRTLETGSIENCLNEAVVTGTKKTGGICGSLWGGTITACANTGDITGNSGSGKDGIGGICGSLGDPDPKGTEQGSESRGGTVTGCYSTGAISSNAKWVGGIAGFADSKAVATNCYTTGTVTGYGQYNPIIGQSEGTASYNYCLDTTIINDDDGIYNAGGTKTGNKALTAAEMKASAFVDTLNEQAAGRWQVNCGSTPVLNWQTGKAHSYVDGVCTVCGDTKAVLNPVEDKTSSVAAVTAPADGWKLGENTFTVSSTDDIACVVLVQKADGTYEKLTTTNEGTDHSFTATLGEGDKIIVAVKGDFNMDGKVNGRDTMLVNRAVSGAEYTELQNLIAHVVNSGDKISGRDTMMINRVASNVSKFAW